MSQLYPRSSKGPPDAAGFRNQGLVQNQATRQHVHGPQYFGSVTINNGGSTPGDVSDDTTANMVKDILASLAFPGMLDRRDGITQPHPGTCDWVFDVSAYRHWRDLPHGLLWIKGKPGSGKSTLMSYLLRKLREERQTETGVYLNFFFAARGSELQYTPVGMLRSLLNQLLRQDPSIVTILEDSYGEKLSTYGSGLASWVWQQRELERLLLEAIITSSQHKQVMVLIDALDEAGGDTAQKVMQYFHGINDRVAALDDRSHGCRLKFCISSRHYPIVSAVRGLEVVVEEHNGQDIRDFIEHRLQLDNLAIHESEIPTWHQLKSSIQKYASGMFQWVCLVVPMLLKKLEEGWLLDDTRSFLETLPKDLEDVYTHIFQKDIIQENMSQSLLLFQWVCFSARPLSPTEVMYALASVHHPVSHSLHHRLDENTMKKRIRSLSGGLVEVKSRYYGESDVVQVIHQTVREYLVNGRLGLLFHLAKTNELFPRNGCKSDAADLASQCNANLFDCCLNYLDSLLTRSASSSDLETWNAQANYFEREISAEKSPMSFPFVEYATGNLLRHMENAADLLFWKGHKSIAGKIETIIFALGQKNWNFFPQISQGKFALCLGLGSTICHIAAYLGLVNVMWNLLHSGYAIDPQNEIRQTPLHLASLQGHQAIGQMLLQAGASVNIPTILGSSPLTFVAGEGNIMFASLLIQNGAHVNHVIGRGESALTCAIRRGHVALARLLVNAGADVNILGVHGSALLLAVSMGHLEVAQVLIDAGADVNAHGDQQETALIEAVRHGGNELVKMLLDAGAHVNVLGVEHGTALHAAAYYGQIESVRALIDAGADVNIRGGEYGIALSAAAGRGHRRIVRMLLDAGADVNAKGGKHGSALHAALYKGRREIVRMLFDAGADMNARVDEHCSAPVAACYDGHRDIVRIRIKVRADVADDNVAYSPSDGDQLTEASLRRWNESSQW